jgi:hypothetical protein
MIASDSTVIRTLRIKTAASDRLAARQQIERALQTVALRPIGLPRDAILIVRHIKSRHAGAAGWEQAVNTRLDQLARQAAHPIEGVVPAHAEAVIFADRAELLACLAADWCAGVVRSQWWWQSLLRGDNVTRAVSDAWLAAPEVIPLALQRLAARQKTIVFVQRLSDTQVQSFLQAVVRTFGLYQLSSTVAEISAMEWIDREVITVSPAPAPPWQPWMQTRIEYLSPDRQVLLAVGLMLTAVPSIVRSASFASDVKAWHDASRTTPQIPPDVSTPVSPATPSAPLTIESIAMSQVEATLNTLTVQPEESVNAEPSLRGARLTTRQSPSDQHDTPAVSESILRPSPTPEAAALLTPYSTPDMTDGKQSQIEIETEFGGVCYFINLGLFLNLYGDFTTPLQPGLDLSIWDFIALVTQELCGEEVTHDPIWPLLAQLADRAEDEPPGANFNPPGDWIRGFSRLIEWSHVPAEASTPAESSSSLPKPTSWLVDLMSIVRLRLQLALGVNDDELPRYFKQRARIVVSALNFDAYFALADLPIEIRLSGLDRDPGWVPAAGRRVRFHYD